MAKEMTLSYQESCRKTFKSLRILLGRQQKFRKYPDFIFIIDQITYLESKLKMEAN